MDLNLIFAALAAFLLFLFIIAILFRVTRQEAAILDMLWAFVGVGVAVAFLFAGSWGMAQYVWWASMYGLFSALFVFGIFSLVEASVTLRILTEIARVPSGIPMRQLLQRYNRFRIIKRRIARLVYSGELKESGGVFTLGKKSYFTLREIVFEFLRKIFPRE